MSPHDRIRRELLKGVGGFLVLLVLAATIGGAVRGFGNDVASLGADVTFVVVLIYHVNRASRRVASARIDAGRELLELGRADEALEVLLPFGHGFNRKFDRQQEALDLIKRARKAANRPEKK